MRKETARSPSTKERQLTGVTPMHCRIRTNEGNNEDFLAELIAEASRNPVSIPGDPW